MVDITMEQNLLNSTSLLCNVSVYVYEREGKSN